MSIIEKYLNCESFIIHILSEKQKNISNYFAQSNKDQNILKVGTTDGTFMPADIIVGSASSARYSIDYIENAKFEDKYEDNDQIEKEADLIVDFTEKNPFGNY